MSENTRKIAVITGDLVKSTELGPKKIERAFAALEDCARVQEDWHGAPLHFTRHRGDGWQVMLARPEIALRSALTFRAALRSEGNEFDSYMGIAEGEIEGIVGPDLNKAYSIAFLASGFTLERAKEPSSNHIAHEDNGYIEAVASLADLISENWTSVQASALLHFLAPGYQPSFTDVADALGKSRQTVTKSAEAAGLYAITYSLDVLESELRD